MGSVCVNGRCGFREKSERRDCPKCGWLMLDGPLPETGSIAPPPKVRNMKQLGGIVGAGAVLFLGAIGMVAGSFASTDPVASHQPVAAAPASVVEDLTPVATPAPVVAAAAPAPVKAIAAKATVAKAVAKKAPAKKSAPKKTVASKKTTAKKATKVARR